MAAELQGIVSCCEVVVKPGHAVGKGWKSMHGTDPETCRNEAVSSNTIEQGTNTDNDFVLC